MTYAAAMRRREFLQLLVLGAATAGSTAALAARVSTRVDTKRRPIMRVRRSLDGAEMDVATIEEARAFCAGAGATVVRVYDQGRW